MKSQYLKTLIAVVLLGALWGGFVLYSRHKSHEPAKKSKPPDKVLPLENSQITAFTLERPGAPALTCQRESEGWAIIKPRAVPADPAGVSVLLSSLTGAAVEEVIDPHPADLKPYGLATPAESVEVTANAQPQHFALRLGDETPTGGGVYAQVEGKPQVIKLAASLRDALKKSVFDLRDKRAVTLATDQIQRIDVSGNGIAYTLLKNPEGVWDLDLPPTVRADHFTVDNLVSTLHNLKMQSVAAEDKERVADFGLTSPAFTIALSGPGASQIVQLGKKEKTPDGERTYAINSQLAPIFTVNSSLLSQFEKKAGDLRAKDLFTFSVLDVEHLDLTTPQGHRVFDQQAGKWKQTLPSAKNEDSSKMQDLLYALSDLHAESFPSGLSVADAGLSKPAYSFTVSFGDKGQSQTVEISPVQGRLYARRSTDLLPCELPKNALDDLEKSLKAL
jgi:Domain of unknown function (DUF4340)